MEHTLRETALKQAAACARERYPGEGPRIERGLLLALNDAVTIHPDMSASVQSGTDREVSYLIDHGWCDCPDRHHAPGARCKHVYALHLHLIASMALKAHDSTLTPDPLMP
jgi:hypothetical protein